MVLIFFDDKIVMRKSKDVMVLKLRQKLYFILSVCFATLVLASSAYAISENYQNNLNGLDVKKVGDKSLGVTLYTDSQYKEPVKVIKKSDTQYDLLLPETSNSAANSIAKDLQQRTGGLVKDVELKHYSYPTGNLNNGYTKVTITTSEPGVGISATSSPQNTAVSSKDTMPQLKTDTQAGRSKPALRTEQARVVPKKQVADKENKVETTVKAQTKKVVKKANKATQKVKAVTPVKKQKKQATQPIAKPVVEETPIQLSPQEEAPPDNNDIQQEVTAESVENSQNEIKQEDDQFGSNIEYEEAVRNTLKDKWRENENVLLLICAILLIPMIILMNKIKKLPQRERTPKSIIRHTPKTKSKLVPTKYQQELINIMDNSNLSWQERYSLLKKQEHPEPKPVQKVENKEQSQQVPPPKPVPIEIKRSKIQGHLNIAKFSGKTSQNDNPQSTPEMLAQVQISANKGFYLTKFEDQTFLIGYIGENVFVIRKFGKMKVSSLQARLNETRKNGERYLIKVGTYKALVEVTDQMKLILEL